jgi:dTDP-4-dehydrorhamnose reductase
MKILLIGSNGFLGKKLWSHFGKLSHQIITPTHAALDICDKSGVNHVFEKTSPELTILAAAFTNVDGCERDKESAYNVNVLGTKNIIKACQRQKTRLVFFSTDFVFDGLRGNYTEEDEPNPQSYYGKTKRMAEEAIEMSGLDFIIERVSVLYGYNDYHDKLTFEKWVKKSLEEGKPINVVSDQYSCPTLIDDIAYATQVLTEKEESGFFHVVGSECISRYDFARRIAYAFSLDETLITPVSTEMLSQIALRPRNSCLSTEKIKKCSITMSDTKIGLQIMKRCMQKTLLDIYPKDHNPKVPQ